MIKGIELVDWRNQDEVIKFYEANNLYFNNYKDRTDLNSKIEIIDIKLSYCNALIGKKHYTDCLEVLTHLNIMMENLKIQKFDEYSSKYERYLFTEAVVLGYLKRFEESQNNFKELLRIDPKNDLYKNWFESNRTKIIARQSNIVGYAGCGIILIVKFFDIVLKKELSNYVDLVGLLTMTLGFTFPYILRLIRKIK